MSGASAVREYISKASESLVTRRELIAFVLNESVVDSELRRLCASGTVVRVAAGVYSIPTKRSRLETSFAIASIRCRSFRKEIFAYPERAENETTETSFLSNGCKTSFESIHGRIFLKPIAPRKLKKTEKTATSAPNAAHAQKVLRTAAYQSLELDVKHIMAIWSQWFMRLIDGDRTLQGSKKKDAG